MHKISPAVIAILRAIIRRIWGEAGGFGGGGKLEGSEKGEAGGFGGGGKLEGSEKGEAGGFGGGGKLEGSGEGEARGFGGTFPSR